MLSGMLVGPAPAHAQEDTAAFVGAWRATVEDDTVILDFGAGGLAAFLSGRLDFTAISVNRTMLRSPVTQEVSQWDHTDACPL